MPRAVAQPDDGRAVLLPLKFLPGAVMGAISGPAGSQCCKCAPHNGAGQSQQARYERSSHGSRLVTAEENTPDWRDIRNRGETPTTTSGHVASVIAGKTLRERRLSRPAVTAPWADQAFAQLRGWPGCQ